MAAHVLAHGLNDASLRPLARAAGTSDRMLIYHFGSKDALIAALLTHLGCQFRALLDTGLPQGRFADDRAAALAILDLMQSDKATGFQVVWFDILAASARGSGAHRQTGGAILASLQDWLAARLPQGRPRAQAADLLLRIEGILIAAALGRDDLVQASLAALPDGPTATDPKSPVRPDPALGA